MLRIEENDGKVVTSFGTPQKPDMAEHFQSLIKIEGRQRPLTVCLRAPIPRRHTSEWLQNHLGRYAA
ncbi:hypothetical protein TNCV_1746221 [Trichonephila clavipes]|nr:hypothetical protein TNCV_1746221 [Trichonephila clavipes]